MQGDGPRHLERGRTYRRVDRARRDLWERRWVEETAEARAEREHEEPHAQVEAERGGRRGRGRTRVERRGRGQRILISSACPEQTDNQSLSRAIEHLTLLGSSDTIAANRVRWISRARIFWEDGPPRPSR